MYAYIIRRLLLILPTLLGIMVINFAIIQFVPGGPVEQMIAQITGETVDATARVGGGAGQETQDAIQSKTSAGKTTEGGAGRYRGGQGLPPELIRQIEKQFGMDKPLHERFLLMMGNFIKFDFGIVWLFSPLTPLRFLIVTVLSLNSFSPQMIATRNSRLFASSSCFPRFFLALKNTSALILFSLNKSTSS